MKFQKQMIDDLHVPTTQVAVDEFFVNELGEVDVFRYGVLLTWCEPESLYSFIAGIIDDCVAIGVEFNDLQGGLVVSSIIQAAVHDEVGVHFIPHPAIQDDTVVIVGHSEGGVHLAIGDGEAWDPTMWQLRFGPRGAA